MVQPLKVRNAYVISSHIFLGMSLLIHAGFQVNLYKWKEPQMSKS